MNATYQHLALAEVKPGMILSDELLDQQGHVLLPKGAVLSAATIALLPSHGVDMLPVLRTDGPADPETGLDPSTIERRLAHLFRKNDIDNHDDWATGMLRRYVSDYRLERGLAP
jgi:hypothetical protein